MELTIHDAVLELEAVFPTNSWGAFIKIVSSEGCFRLSLYFRNQQDWQTAIRGLPLSCDFTFYRGSGSPRYYKGDEAKEEMRVWMDKKALDNNGAMA